MKPRFLLLAAFACLAGQLCAAAPTNDALSAQFQSPPNDTRPTVRWWWFGPAVVKPQLEREMRFMQEGGFGGFEVQPTYPLALDGTYPGLKNLKFLSPEFLDMLRFTAAKAKETGLRMDLTLGSGWPYGGPMFSREEAVQSIADAGTVSVMPGQKIVEAPQRTGRGSVRDALVVAALLGPVNDAPAGTSPFVPLQVNGRVAQLPSDLRGATQVRFFVYAQAGLMQVKRPAFGDEGFIVDHYAPGPIEKFIRMVAQPEIAACGPDRPYSIFCDSLEIAGEGWTPNLPAEFQRRRGYDLIPLLPALFDPEFPDAAAIRGDYAQTIAELFDDVFVDRFTRLAHETGTRFRLQAYGTPPTTLSTYARVDVDEGENYSWRALSGTRWAASASHLLGRTETSSEAFTWLHSPVFMAAPIDIKLESNLQFLNGVNHLLFHGWPYTAPGVEYPGWRFYAAGVFNEKNPWWIVMPDITRYLARTSFLLRQGQPVNDVAVYLPEEDAFASMTPSNLQMLHAGGRGLLNGLVNPVIPSVLDAGFNFDGIDAGMLAARGKVEGSLLAFGDLKFRAVVLPEMKRITPASLRTLEAFANAGGVVIAVGTPPSIAPGYRTTAAEQEELRATARRLFTGPGAKGLVVPVDQLAATLAAKLPPDVILSAAKDQVGVVHRRLGDTDLYFVANTGAEPVKTTATFRCRAAAVEWWDADSGRITSATAQPGANATTVEIDLAPYGAKFLVFSPAARASRALEGRANGPSLDLSSDWHVSFKNAAPEPNPAATQLAALASWTDQPATRFFSGVATYTKTFELPASLAGSALELDFGEGRAAAVPGGAMGLRANFQPPIGDGAVVYVNGQRVGALWCPPYRLDVSRFLRAGRNELRVDVGNRAVNYMADAAHHPAPDYTALNASREYGGNRFQMQDMSAIQPTPSGLLGTVRLVPEANQH